MNSPDAYTAGPSADIDLTIEEAWAQALADVRPGDLATMIEAQTFESDDPRPVGFVEAHPTPAGLPRLTGEDHDNSGRF